MFATLQCVVLDCPNPAALAAFYHSLLGGTVDLADPRWSLDENWSTLHTPTGFVLAFQRVSPYHPPQWPDPSRPQQFHLDSEVTDLDRAHTEALTCGATPLDTTANRWRVYADPAGHPFCLVHH
ncbi:VOC family protein [Actinokineospora inagensis]|uniref:VOC family protein n=1 Tax=Actinokineospora inagensis TaxID=103730 RepID=UPI00040BDC0F|nr:VOC family protein [Actinokineospora inagensis]